MSKSTGTKTAAPRKLGSQILTGILVGMVIGVGMSAGLTWYILKSPSPFLQKEQVVSKPPAVAQKPSVSAGVAATDAQPATAASGVGDAKPRFEFYKVLTDKQDTIIVTPPKHADKSQSAKPQAAESKPTAADEPYFLQAGSFSNVDDAEKLKARLALLGVEAGIQIATIPDKGVWHRVRAGPYKNTDEMNSARTLLKQNGLDATPIRSQ